MGSISVLQGSQQKCFLLWVAKARKMGTKLGSVLGSRELALSPIRAPLPPFLIKLLLGVREMYVCGGEGGSGETCKQMHARVSTQRKQPGGGGCCGGVVKIDFCAFFCVLVSRISTLKAHI